MRPSRKKKYPKAYRSAKGVNVIQLTPDEREEYGCIVSFSNDQSRWFPGLDGLKDGCAYADERGLKIRCISKPESIYRDLQGVRHQIDHGNDKESRVAVYMPESRMLGIIGRKDLLETPPPDYGKSNKKAW